MRNPSLHEKRNQQVLADVVRAYIETGEPVSSRAVAERHAEPLSPATIRNVMACLEQEGYLYQPHTSAGRVPTESGYRFYVQRVVESSEIDPGDEALIRGELAGRTPEEIMERASHVLAAVSQALGIVVSPPVAKTVVEHLRFLLLPDGRVLVVLISRGGLTRDKVARLERSVTQEELDRTAGYLNRHFAGRTLEEIRADLTKRLARDRERYNQLVGNALVLCDPEFLSDGPSREVFVEGTAQIAAQREFAGQAQLQELLAAIETRKQLIALLTSCIESPEPVHVQIGVPALPGAGDGLALVSAPYSLDGRVQGTLGILGPVRMRYDRAVTAVALVARLFDEARGVSLYGERKEPLRPA
jgi:heat-inducible transcriptional repressor